MKIVEKDTGIDNPLIPFGDVVRGFNFKVGSTSYVWPAGYLDNSQKLSKIFSVVQLLILETLETYPIDEPEINGLRELRENGLDFVLHLPVPSNLADKNVNPVEPIIKIIETFRTLDVSLLVLHIEAGEEDCDLKLAAQRITEICQRTKTDPAKICVENLHAPFAPVWDAVAGTGVSICFDAGHILYAGGNPFSFIEKYGERIRMTHIHGVDEKKNGLKIRDHRPLSSMEPGLLKKIFDKLRSVKFDGPVIIENYSVAEMVESLRVLSSLISAKDSV